MSSEKPHFEKDFYSRLDNWVEKQGIIFQLRHARGIGDVIRIGLKISVRVLLLLVVAIVVGYFYLKGLPKKQEFADGVLSQIVEATGAAEGSALDGVSRIDRTVVSADLKLGKLSLVPSETTFFEGWQDVVDGEVSEPELVKATGVELSPFGLLDAVKQEWSATSMQIQSLRLQLRARAETDADAQAFYQQLLRSYPDLPLQDFSVTNLDFCWGKSDGSRGEITGTKLTARRHAGGWKFLFEGGTLNYMWMRDAQLETMEVACLPDGISISNASLKLALGTLNFSSATVTVEAQPKVEAEFEFSKLKVVNLSPDLKGWVEGQISGEGKLFGDLNSSEGLDYDLDVSLSEDDRIEVRDRFPILQSMALLDTTKSYTRILFEDGAFMLTKRGEVIEVKDIYLESHDLLDMRGFLQVTQAAFKKTEKLGSFEDGISTSALDSSKQDLSSIEQSNTDEVSLRPHYKGRVMLVFPNGILDRVDVLAKAFAQSKRKGLDIVLTVNLDGWLESLTKKAAADMDKLIKKQSQ